MLERRALKMPSERRKPVHPMTTPSQTAANQADAQHSTGPKTQEGKTRSAENNLRHGLAAGRLIIPANAKPNTKPSKPTY
jgi:hypothetical protein